MYMAAQFAFYAALALMLKVVVIIMKLISAMHFLVDIWTQSASVDHLITVTPTNQPVS